MSFHRVEKTELNVALSRWVTHPMDGIERDSTEKTCLQDFRLRITGNCIVILPLPVKGSVRD